MVAGTDRQRTSAYSAEASATTAPALPAPTNFKAPHAAAELGHWYQYKVRAVGPGAAADSPVLSVEMGAPTRTTLSVSPNQSEEGQNVAITAAAGKPDVLLADSIHGMEVLPQS